MDVVNVVKNIGLNPFALTVILWISFFVMRFTVADDYDKGEELLKAFGILVATIIVTAAGVWVFNENVWDWMTSLRFYLLVGSYAS